MKGRYKKEKEKKKKKAKPKHQKIFHRLILLKQSFAIQHEFDIYMIKICEEFAFSP